MARLIPMAEHIDLLPFEPMADINFDSQLQPPARSAILDLFGQSSSDVPSRDGSSSDIGCNLFDLVRDAEKWQRPCPNRSCELMIHPPTINIALHETAVAKVQAEKLSSSMIAENEGCRQIAAQNMSDTVSGVGELANRVLAEEPFHPSRDHPSVE
ncbi:hypothetical protein CDV31_016823 [Fusarium ambrosium]|uniref:Uncharacterized protein n=1 Tax=Fusarium ambrosium TaxID=131363 RepID=A0A428S125_9HYPO|nr:hypothetical protein CDV31_016823 [Fusarium ambrosium]